MFSKWDIIYASKFPDTVKCDNLKCGLNFSIEKHTCPHCNKINNISNIVAKTRPIILWHDQLKWFRSMTFGIPLSTSRLENDSLNQVVYLSDYQYLFPDNKFQNPMRAIICQASRLDGSALKTNMLIGKLTNSVVQTEIEDKLFSWLFSEIQ